MGVRGHQLPGAVPVLQPFNGNNSPLNFRTDYTNPARPVPYDRNFGMSSSDRNYDPRMPPTSQPPSFEVDHLATFTVTHEETRNPEAGISKLSTMANTSGIWTMKCMLSIDREHLIINEKGTSSELDCFPLSNIYNPFAINKPEKCDVYNNLVVLSVIDSTKRDNQAQMHIFLAGSIPAQDIVDIIINAKTGRPSNHFNYNKNIPPPPAQPAPDPPNFANAKSNFGALQDRPMNPALGGQDMLKTENSERDGQLLNHCFDDIEKFVARLQKAAESYKELERLKKDKGWKDRKGRQEIEDRLTMSALPPKPQDFVDIFQKFKLSFNLLAKLKGHIHDPNAPELVHFIFTPLSLIYEASRDPTHGNRNLAANVYSPMLTAEAKDLLLNCLTSKEVDLWMSFGEGWTTSREDYKGYIPPYTPRFYNGWHPVPSDDYTQQMTPGIPKTQPSMIGPNRPPAPTHDSFVQDKMVPPNQRYTNNLPTPSVPDKTNDIFIRALRDKGAKYCDVTHSREKKNAKELTVVKGEVLEIIDDTRNWWKLRNCKGQVGHAPFTILNRQSSMGPIDNGGNGNIFRTDLQNSGAGSSVKDNTNMVGVDNIAAQIDNVNISGNSHYTQEYRKQLSPSISSNANQPEVRSWLQGNGFTAKTSNILWKYDAQELFKLTRQDLEQMLGFEEGYKLHCLLDAYKRKKKQGYTNELEAVLRNRRGPPEM